MNKNNKEGFTMVEILITIGILIILTSAVIIAVNPSEKLLSARNSQRTAHVEAVYGAISHYFFQNDLFPSCVTTGATDIFSCTELVSDYLFELPVDPVCGGETETGYHVKKMASTNDFGVKANCAEGEEEITAGYWQDE